MADFVEKIMGCIYEFLRLRLNRLVQLVSWNFSSHAPLLAAQVSIFEKIDFLFHLVFYLSKSPQSFSSSVFTAKLRVLKSLFPESKPSQVCYILIFQSWHTRNTLYLTLAYLRSTLVRCPSYSLPKVSWVCVQVKGILVMG